MCVSRFSPLTLAHYLLFTRDTSYVFFCCNSFFAIAVQWTVHVGYVAWFVFMYMLLILLAVLHRGHNLGQLVFSVV